MFCLLCDSYRAESHTLSLYVSLSLSDIHICDIFIWWYTISGSVTFLVTERRQRALLWDRRTEEKPFQCNEDQKPMNLHVIAWPGAWQIIYHLQTHSRINPNVDLISIKMQCVSFAIKYYKVHPERRSPSNSPKGALYRIFFETRTV